MIGLHQPVEIAPRLTPELRSQAQREGSEDSSQESAALACPSNNKVIGVICSGDVAVYRDQVKTALERGLEQRPDAVWVCVEPKSDRMTHDVMLSLGLDPVVLPMIDAWRTKDDEYGYDLRRQWRDTEMLLCDELIIFHKRTGSSPWRERKKWSDGNCGVHRNLFVVELGPEPAKRRAKTRKPVGA